jgi:DNA polymerase elongation subunit (family B)
MMRKQFKKEMKNGKTADERLVADKKQYAIKIILNATFGAMGFNFFRLFVPECADTITYFGRIALNFAMENLSSQGIVLYGDTDSCHFNSMIRYRILKK